MKLDRRQLIRGALGLGAAAIILPPTLEENVELGRRIWALGAIPQKQETIQFLNFRYLGYTDAILEPMNDIALQEYGELVKVPATRELITVTHPYEGTLNLPIPSYATDNTVRR